MNEQTYAAHAVQCSVRKWYNDSMDDEKKINIIDELGALLDIAYRTLLAVDAQVRLAYCVVCRRATSYSSGKHNEGCIVEQAILALGKK